MLSDNHMLEYKKGKKKKKSKEVSGREEEKEGGTEVVFLLVRQKSLCMSQSQMKYLTLEIVKFKNRREINV